MSGPTSKTTWKAFERVIAAAVSKIFGEVTTRTPLSGMNSGHGPGDVIIPIKYSMVIEAKYRAASNQHSLFRAAQADAVKHKINPKNVFLYTKVKRELGYLVTLDADVFHEILAVPGAIDLFKKQSIA